MRAGSSGLLLRLRSRPTVLKVFFISPRQKIFSCCATSITFDRLSLDNYEKRARGYWGGSTVAASALVERQGVTLMTDHRARFRERGAPRVIVRNLSCSARGPQLPAHPTRWGLRRTNGCSAIQGLLWG